MMDSGIPRRTVFEVNGTENGQSRGNDRQPPGRYERERQPGQPLDRTVQYGKAPDGLRPNDIVINAARELSRS